MAKVTAPLHSIEASGSIGQTMTMLRQMGRNIAKKKSAPTGQPSQAQAARRAFYKSGTESWAATNQYARDDYIARAKPIGLTGFNLFMREYLAQPQTAGTSQWDAGTTTWDAGATTWDNFDN